MSGQVRCDRKARPFYEAIAEAERAAIEAAIPEGHVVTVLHTNATPPFTVRLVMESRSESQPAILIRARQGWHLLSTVRGVLPTEVAA